MLPDIVKVEGIVLALGGEDYLFAPLALGPARALFTRIQSVQQSDQEAVDLLEEVAYHSLRRNYPSMTREQVGELVGIDQFDNVFRAAMDMGPLRRQLEADKPGERARLG